MGHQVNRSILGTTTAVITSTHGDHLIIRPESSGSGAGVAGSPSSREQQHAGAAAWQQHDWVAAQADCESGRCKSEQAFAGTTAALAILASRSNVVANLGILRRSDIIHPRVGQYLSPLSAAAPAVSRSFEVYG